MARMWPINVEVQLKVFGDDKPVHGQDPDRTSDMTNGPSEEWPVQLFYGAESERKFKRTQTRSVSQQHKLHKDTLYLGEHFVAFWDEGEVVMIPLPRVSSLFFYAPDGIPKGML